LGERILYVPSLPASVFQSIYDAAGLENFSMMMYDHPGVIDGVLERGAELGIRMAEVYNDLYKGPVVHCCDDLGIKGSTLVSPDWLRQHIFPRMKRVVAAIEAGGKRLSYHTCGNVNAVVDDIVEAGAKLLEPLERLAGMDIAQVKRRHGGDLVLVGNGNYNIRQMGTLDEVRCDVRRCLDAGSPGGGYLFEYQITQTTALENCLAMMDEVTRFTPRA
jgi:uroporphyrinogen decarboxylase